MFLCASCEGCRPMSTGAGRPAHRSGTGTPPTVSGMSDDKKQPEPAAEKPAEQTREQPTEQPHPYAAAYPPPPGYQPGYPYGPPPQQPRFWDRVLGMRG